MSFKTLNTPNYTKSNSNLHKKLVYKDFSGDLKNMIRQSKDKSAKENVSKRLSSSKIASGSKKIKLNLNRLLSLD